MEIDEIDVTPFVEATAGVYDKLGYGDLSEAAGADPRPVRRGLGAGSNASRPVPGPQDRARCCHCWCASEAAFGKFLLIVIVVLVFAAGLLRWFDHPLIWSVDLAQLLFLWVSFIGANQALRKRAHIGMDLLVRPLAACHPPRG